MLLLPERCRAAYRLDVEEGTARTAEMILPELEWMASVFAEPVGPGVGFGLGFYRWFVFFLFFLLVLFQFCFFFLFVFCFNVFKL